MVKLITENVHHRVSVAWGQQENDCFKAVVVALLCHARHQKQRQEDSKFEASLNCVVKLPKNQKGKKV